MEMTTIKTARAADLVADHIEALILEGTLRPGESLLPERELADRLAVSRPTLRDGLKKLEQRGLLTSSHGRGLKVAQLGTESISDPLLSMLARHSEAAEDYLEFRDAIETSAAALAAQRANEVDLSAIRNCLDRIDRAHARNEPKEEAEADTQLHMAIYEASHNLVILQVMRALSQNLRSDVFHNRTRLFSMPHVRDLLRNQHEDIGNAIISHDAEAARDAAHRHLSYLQAATREIRDAEANLGVSLRRLERGGLASDKSTVV
jgi:GntR family transcriptional repressor for pyruvate dehydrogenase complex